VTVRAPGKVNLHLGVGPLRDDGYHDVTNVLHAVSLYDEVVATEADELSVTVTGEDASGVPADYDNLAAKAAIALAEVAGRSPDVALSITKRLPVAGGMAGGSADAAATLVACSELWSTGHDRDDLVDIAASLGADVPFLLTGGTALGRGRGDRLMPVLGRGTYHWVLAFSDDGLSTADVYAELDLQRGGDRPDATPADPAVVALRDGDPDELATALHNDLERPALRLRPALRKTLDTGLDLGALGAMVSGSGPTCAFLCAGNAEAVRLASALAGAGVCRSTRAVHGPVAGAHVIEQVDGT
jgi:4-diphosphocytidyl-2-C-methyl-D-erythritol kinase